MTARKKVRKAREWWLIPYRNDYGVCDALATKKQADAWDKVTPAILVREVLPARRKPRDK